jgi:imidazolonepropionase-like amidohydrolase
MTSDKPIKSGFIRINSGKIAEISSGLPSDISGDDFNAAGMSVYPGFIDAHTHLGIIEDGLGFEGDDCNESSDPFTPQMRACDAINPFDKCFAEARNRGITAAASSPGSSNPCGGQISVIKTNGRRVDDMLVRNAGIKFALGENPKTVFNDRDESPVTRMATAAIIREGLFKAKRYSQQLDDYNCDPDNFDPPDFDIKSESLIPLLQHKVKAFFHCHRADDICTALRIAKEFSLDCVIIHGTEGYLIADILADENVPVICGPILCDRCKPEMKGLDIKNPAELSRCDVKIAICTDHTVIPIQYLPLSALTAQKGGLPHLRALKAITCDAADILGVSDFIGSLAVGMDADLQIYPSDCNPLDLLSEPAFVMIDGSFIS